MVKVRIPGTDRVLFVSDMNTDVVINMSDYSDDSSITQEDTVVIGDWSDYSGNGTAYNQTKSLIQGIQNEFDLDPILRMEGVRLAELTERGNRATTMRTRNKSVYLKVNDGK